MVMYGDLGAYFHLKYTFIYHVYCIHHYPIYKLENQKKCNLCSRAELLCLFRRQRPFWVITLIEKERDMPV